MFDPTFPARIRHIIEEENSSNIISRVTYPTVQRGIHGLSIFNLIWMVITAPMKNEINNTIPMEFTPSCSNSLRYCRKNIRIRSGREKVRPISMKYLPTVLNAFIITHTICLQMYIISAYFYYICRKITRIWKKARWCSARKTWLRSTVNEPL